VHENTVRKSIEEAISLGLLTKETIPGKYNKKLLRVVRKSDA
jgi:hypothetical protein